MAAGMASTLAAAVTSRFGVAGTILGAGITAMIVTGGAAILKAYLESAAGKVREMPRKIKRPNGEQTMAKNSEQTMARFGKGSKGSGFPARFRHALGWFSRLPEKNRKSILKRGLIGALGAFVICLVAITLLEFGIGNSLSCGLWGNCPSGATPGIHLTGAERQLGAGSSATFGRPKAGGAAPGVVPGEQPTPSTASPQPDPSTSTASPQPDPSTSTASPQPDPSTSTANPQPDPSTSTASPQADPSTASPKAAPQGAAPSTASPEAAPQGSVSSASPEAAPSRQ